MASYKLYTDTQLVHLLRKNDHAAFTEIYVRYSSALYKHAYKHLNNRDEVTDIVQEIFTSFWNRRSDLILRSSLAGYLHIAVRNQVIKIISHRQIKSEYFMYLQTSIEEGFVNTDHLIREKQLVEIIEKEIDELPAKMRLIFNLSRKSFLSHREIAIELNLSESTVKTQVNNALRVLRTKLETLLLLFILLSCLLRS